ncbi:acyl-CoA synthetase [Rhodospirillaceae bacterium KN72]|uniref:3-methylmercaptopropionyl-CoA ligase n=1 Tax=Pacificispira spongiicola TaxID=2729598 RepID=A0A7Y0HG36_9PROT|nr:acyl-CoA synthetase [Pacificispira spongiicola]NMM43944.1 acyl-CoA synthetase [Pacificispira spongiicola]
MTNAYASGLGANAANYVPLTPISFLRRTASVYPDRVGIVHGEIRRSWAEIYERCRRLASALSRHGIGRDDTVAIMAPNVPAFIEAHFGVPMCGAVLNSLNIRLDPEAIAFILNHGEAKVLLTDREFSGTIEAALKHVETKPLVIDIDDPLAEGGALIGVYEYEDFLAMGAPAFEPIPPQNEWDAIALNYTSGTTGDPKGVVYHHRGAYLNALGNVVSWAMPHFPVYLWTLPMFHCNGWCFPWTITAMAGTHVCLRKVVPEAIFKAIADHAVTHLCGAPIVMSMMAEFSASHPRNWDQPVSMMTAGAAPPAAVIGAMEEIGISVNHVYGLTEVFGPCVVCAWHPEWDSLPLERRTVLKARQGVPYEVQEDIMVADPDSMEPVPPDGTSIGEIFLRGNIVMKGYLKNPETTEAAFAGGWFHSGDLAVMHPNGYVEIKDRSKDIIISGGENISSVEVEDVLYRHPDILMAAVVAKPDEKWGETPCAFVELRAGSSATAADIMAFCRERLAGYKCPKFVVFSELPKTSTGKVQKFQLREQAKSL